MIASGSISGTGAGAAVSGLQGPFTFGLTGSVAGTVALERSADQGATWGAVAADGYGTALALSSAVTVVVVEPEPGVQFRANCTAYTSGPFGWRFGQ